MPHDVVDPLVRNDVRVTGAIDRSRAMVFVHGFGTDQTAWREVASAFADDFKIVSFDSVGSGKIDPTAYGHVQSDFLNLEVYATHLIEICEALGLDKPVLVGHSLGAMTCVVAANRRPELFSRLVLIAASPRYLDADGYRGGLTPADVDNIYAAIVERYGEWADAFAPIAMGNPEKPELARYFAETIRSIPPKWPMTVLCSILQQDHRDTVRKVSLPTLLIQSAEDFCVPAEVAHFLNRSIAGSRLMVIDATGHLPHVSAPRAVIAAMSEFVRG